MLVRDVMTRKPRTVTVDTTLKRTAQVLSEHGLTSMPVLDAKGRLCGVVSEADLIREAFVPDPRSHLIPSGAGTAVVSRARYVDDVMTPHAMTVHESTDVAEAAELMTETTVKSLPVVDDDLHLVGVVSRSDLVRARARADEAIEREIDALLVSIGRTTWLVEVTDGRVEIEGPATARDRSIAEVAASTVPGVIGVTVR